MKAFLDEAIERQEKHLVCTETVDKGHGRVEVRRYWQTEKLEWFADQSAWEGLRSVGAVESRRTLRGKESVERRYYLSSLGNDAENLAQTRRLAINLLRQDKTCKRGIKGKLLRAAIDPDYLKSILKI